MTATRPFEGRVRTDLTEPLTRVLEWMVSHEDASGALVCPVHRIEHTGKSAGAIVLAVELAKHAQEADRDRLFAIARKQSVRLVERLVREPDSTCFTFRPGRHDPYNCSNSVIDGGACSDALATFVMAFGDRLDAEERERYTHASVLHAQTYLRYAIIDKGIPAQCAWAMTGAAQAYRLSEHEVLRYVCEVGAERIAKWQRGDGSFPYHPLDQNPAHPGASDASAYYQSRVNAFMSFALEASMGERGVELDTTVTPGLDFLHGITGADGVKAGAIEAKPWYWGAEYEVASHPFDIAAYAVEWRRTRSPRAAAALRASWGAWVQHLAPNGEPRSHREAAAGEAKREASYQCPFFWAAHASWIARSLPELNEAFDGAGDGPRAAPGVTHFADVDVARIDTPDLTAWIRGRRPPGNASHGSPVGGLLRVHSRAEGRDLFTARPRAAEPTANWYGRRGAPSPTRGWRAGAEEVRFSTWLARNRARAGAKAAYVTEPWRALRHAVLDFASSTVGPAFDRGAPLQVEGGEVRWSAPFAHRDGTAAGGRVDARVTATPDGGLEATFECTDPGDVRGMRFAGPARGTVEARTARVRFAPEGS